MSITQDVKQALAAKGQATIGEIAEYLGIGEGDARWHNINQALSGGQGKWSQRVARGEYVWLNGSRPAKPAKPAKPAPATAAELQPLIDNLSAVDFKTVGLTYVARTQDGAFICTDQHGVAWRVEVTVTARLI